MRTVLAFAAATAVLGGCSHVPVQSPASQPPPEPWVLIAPPDDTTTSAFLETFEFLPDGSGRFPGAIDGMSEQDRRSLKDLYDQVKAAPTPAASLQILTDHASETEAPVERWRRVRTFKSEEACRSTREELLKVTDTQTRKVGAYAGMSREEFQWPLLEHSFEWSRCVPAGTETEGTLIDGTANGSHG
jgi:hypothetical protein